MTDTRQHLLDNILSIIETLETPTMSAKDYIRAALEIDFLCNRERECKGAVILIKFGRALIFINTCTKSVIAEWEENRIFRCYTDNINLNEAVNELWEMGA